MAMARVRYIDESRALLRQLRRGERRALRQAGILVRDAARSSLQLGTRKTLGELTRRERRVYQIRAAAARRRGRPEPKLPLRRSRPGQPPVISRPDSRLKSGISSAFDAGGDVVVIGPVSIGVGDVPAVLEYGGTSNGIRIEPRPFMRPALVQTVQQGAFGRLFEDMA